VITVRGGDAIASINAPIILSNRRIEFCKGAIASSDRRIVAWKDAIALSDRQIVFCEGAIAPFLQFPSPIQRTPHPSATPIEHMGIDHRGFDILADIIAIFE